MSFIYKYQIPTDTNMKFNLRQKINYAIGRNDFSTSITADNMFNLIFYDSELTPQEKTEVDAIMSDPATVYTPEIPPGVAGSVMQITDIYETIDEFNAQTGINFQIYFVEGTPGSGKIDKILLIPDRALAANEKNSIRGLFAELARWV